MNVSAFGDSVHSTQHNQEGFTLWCLQGRVAATSACLSDT